MTTLRERIAAQVDQEIAKSGWMDVIKTEVAQKVHHRYRRGMIANRLMLLKLEGKVPVGVAFCAALESYIACPNEQDDQEVMLELYQSCGAVWNLTHKVPQLYWHDVRDAIGNAVEADLWDKGGHSYSGAARRVRAKLKLELGLSA